MLSLRRLGSRLLSLSIDLALSLALSRLSGLVSLQYGVSLRLVSVVSPVCLAHSLTLTSMSLSHDATDPRRDIFPACTLDCCPFPPPRTRTISVSTKSSPRLPLLIRPPCQSGCARREMLPFTSSTPPPHRHDTTVPAAHAASVHTKPCCSSRLARRSELLLCTPRYNPACIRLASRAGHAAAGRAAAGRAAAGRAAADRAADGSNGNQEPSWLPPSTPSRAPSPPKRSVPRPAWVCLA